jgi:putative peptidoglycan lipid II flippase
VLLFATPAAVGLLTLAGPLIATIYGYGEFTERDIRMSTLALMTYSLGLLGFSMVKVLAPGYFARQDTRTPVRVGIISLGVNIAFNTLLVLPLARAGFPAPHILLAFSTGLSAVVNSALLFRGLKRAGVYRAGPGWPRLAGQVLIANLAMAIFLWYSAGELEIWLDLSGWQRAQRLAVCVGGGAAVYFAVLWLAGIRFAQLRRLGAGRSP